MNQTIEQIAARILEGGLFLEEAVELLERTLLRRALERTGGNRSAASKLLGIHRNTLQRKLREYKLEQKPVRRQTAKARRAAAG
jgi:DNA-binding NtrC family response regulator